ncbi:unnamed protein product [Rhodiola kirilowii]
MADFENSGISPIRSDVSSGGSGSVDDPYFVSNNEMTGNSIVAKVLTGLENYGTWRKSMEIALSGRSKLAFINGKYPRPSDAVMLAKWQRCNDVVMSWLICSVSEKIVGEILHSKDVMTAWEDLESNYAGTNLARKSALLRELNDCVQNGMAVCDYNRKLNSLYQEIDAINVVKCFSTGNCLCCKQTATDRQGDRVVKFLMGLDDCYASVRSNVLAMTEVPKMVIVYGLVLTEESTRKATKDRNVESSALFSQSNESGNNNHFSQGRGRDGGRGSFGRGRGRVFCTHCQMTGHLKENCYKLIGYPQNNKFQKSGVKTNTRGKFSANSASTSTENGSSEVHGQNTNKAADAKFTTSQLETYHGYA